MKTTALIIFVVVVTFLLLISNEANLSFLQGILILLGTLFFVALLVGVLLLKKKESQPAVLVASASVPRSASANWQRKYMLRVMSLDLASTIWAVAIATTITRLSGRSLIYPSASAVPFLVAVVIFWLLILAGVGSRNRNDFGSGIDEYRRVSVASALWLGAAAIWSALWNFEISFLFLILSAAFGLVSQLTCRWMMRKWLIESRLREGLYCSRVSVLGDGTLSREVIEQLASTRIFGFDVVGEISMEQLDLHQHSEAKAVVEAMRGQMADTLVVAGGSGINSELIREISWHFEPQAESLILAESLVDIAGPRIDAHYVPNLALVRVSTPRFSPLTLFIKRILDLVISLIALIVLSPIMLAVAIAVKLDSQGPIFFHQQRVGYAGQLFRMHKFRSMEANADDEGQSLLDDPRRVTNEVLFKLREDPRVTRVGRFLRSFSLDELPQLVNVLSGEMSLVGPRPPLPNEVLRYEDRVKRKFLVKPGITGLWQISGRSDLDWKQSVRFDLYYVENWSLIQDVQILFRTVSAVFKRRGAY